MVERGFFFALVIALCCLCGCVSAGGMTQDDAATHDLLGRVKAMAEKSREGADEVKADVYDFKAEAEKTRTVADSALKKAVELLEVKKALDKGGEQQQEGNGMNNVVKLAKVAADEVEKVHDAFFFAVGKTASFFFRCVGVTCGPPRHGTSCAVWDERKANVGLEASESVTQAWKKKDEIVAF
ncbi:hypothetical protein DQ04_06471010 [Trypanosoma grayi]|uniref:hypothetical protein n=1 Tax=Trypanosoma grayi TaxID=71804 RepID=UPI0004F47AA4|nr:hypothetical protein DQ04_06471010 [Trypanosoma grayi]KEG08772.1 hypothetical protein DQ04_06471010 [Trypanosoma grayi]